jgi:hypothetical protein
MRTNQTLAVIFSVAWIVMHGGSGMTLHAASAANTGNIRGLGAEADFGEFSAALAPYGRWLEVTGYGTCWSPDVEPHWAPYTEGYWAYTDAGWTWVSREPFGSIVFHYGRWLMTSEGWCWVPGQDWGPAWVSWRTGDKYVGWAPLPPEVPWNAKRGVGSWVDVQSDIGPGYYRFCRVEDFGSPQMREVVFPVHYNPEVFVTTRNVTHITVREETVFCAGPSYVWITSHCVQPVPVLRVVREPSINVFVSYGAGLGFAGFIARDCLFLPAPTRVCKPQPHHFAVAPIQVQRQTTRGWSGDRQQVSNISTYINQEWDKQRTSLTAKTQVPAGGAVILNEIRQAPRPVSNQEKRSLLANEQHSKTPLHTHPSSAPDPAASTSTPTSNTPAIPAFPAFTAPPSRQPSNPSLSGRSQPASAGSLSTSGSLSNSGSLKGDLSTGSLGAAPAVRSIKSNPALRDPFAGNSFVPPAQTTQKPAHPTANAPAPAAVAPSIQTQQPATTIQQPTSTASSFPKPSTAAADGTTNPAPHPASQTPSSAPLPNLQTPPQTPASAAAKPISPAVPAPAPNPVQNPIESPKTATPIAPVTIKNPTLPAGANIPPPAPINPQSRPTTLTPAPLTNSTNGKPSQKSTQTTQPFTQITSPTEIGRQTAVPAQTVISTRSATSQSQRPTQTSLAPQPSQRPLQATQPQPLRTEAGRPAVTNSPFGTNSLNPQNNPSSSTRQIQPALPQSTAFPQGSSRQVFPAQAPGNSTSAFPPVRSGTTAPIQSGVSPGGQALQTQSSLQRQTMTPAPSVRTAPASPISTATSTSTPSSISKPKTTDPNAPKP